MIPTRHRAARLAASLAMLALPGLAQAQQSVTFRVPIQLTNLPPEVSSVSACCEVESSSSATGSGAYRGGAAPASYVCSQQQIAVSGGAASGELAVQMTLSHKNFGAKETQFRYECQARMSATIDGANVFLWPANGNAPPTRSGAFFVRGTSGVGKSN